jgi:hypothetical protein
VGAFWPEPGKHNPAGAGPRGGGFGVHRPTTSGVHQQVAGAAREDQTSARALKTVPDHASAGALPPTSGRLRRRRTTASSRWPTKSGRVVRTIGVLIVGKQNPDIIG